MGIIEALSAVKSYFHTLVRLRSSVDKLDAQFRSDAIKPARSIIR